MVNKSAAIISKYMDTQSFWKIIDQLQHVKHNPATRSSSEREEYQLQKLTELLDRLSIDEILDFEKHLSNAFIKATTQTVVAAAEIVLEGISYDLFDYFLYWLIFQGEESYHAVLKNPDDLIDVMMTGGYPQFEEIGSVAADFYYEKTGNDVPILFDEQSLEEARERAFIPMPKEVAKQLFPKLISEYEESFEEIYQK